MKGHIQPGRTKGSWYIRFEYPSVGDGKRRQRRVTIRGTKADAIKALRKNLYEIESGQLRSSGRMCFSEVLDLWFESRSLRVANRTLHSYDVWVRRYLKPTLGTLVVSEIRPSHIEKALADWSKRQRLDGSAPLSQHSVKHIFDTLRAVCRWAVRMGYLQNSPVDRVDAPHFKRREISTLDPDEIADLLIAANGTDLQPVILAVAGTGLRGSEVLALQWPDIDFIQGTLTVIRTLDLTKGPTPVIRPPKTDESKRVISLPEFVRVALLLQQAEQRQRYEKLEVELRPDAWVFDRSDRLDGLPWNPETFSKAFMRLVKRSDVPRTTFHGLRHAYATIALNAGVNLVTVSRTLGHSEVNTTAKFYVHVIAALKREGAHRVESALGPAVESALSTTVRATSVPQELDRR